MNTRRLLSIAPLVFLAGAANAQFRCDCTRIVDSCNAEVAIRGSSIEVTADQNQCARVDYFVDGLPFVSVVVDGVERREWIPRAEPPRILVQSCQVCQENTASPLQQSAAAPAEAQDAPEASEPGRLEPLISGVPAYPENARGASGYVELDMVVDAGGRVTESRVTASEPPGVFDAAARASVQRWRYPAEAGRAPVTVHERIEFSPPAAAASVPSVERPAPAGAPRNTCVRENTVYNYGDTVDVGLINVCEDPLVVYACAAGSGRSGGRWACPDAEERAVLLVPSGDARLGTQTAIDVPSGLRTFANTDELLLNRPPNTEYWWIACTTADAECRAAARRWSRSVDGQPANVDPQTRSEVSVARSY